LDQLGILAEEVLANVGAAGDGVLLKFAVDHLAHALDEQPALVGGEERIPLAAPDDLDNVPARAAEGSFQLLNDLAVAAHRAVEALQIAVDDPDEVVEPFAPGQGDRAERFRFIALAVADEAPDLAAVVLAQAAMFEVAIEAGLVDAHDRPEAHADGREL